MPTNLPPNYYDVEQRYREAKTPSEKIEFLEEMLTIMPKHKGTDKLRADLRRKISKLKDASQTRKGVGRHESVYRFDKEGGGQVAVVGPPNTGKSSLVAALTNASPKVAEFPCTTWIPTPGMMPYKDIQIQLVDTPPLSSDYIDPEMMDFIRHVDLVLLMVDLTSGTIRQLEESMALLQKHRIVPKRLKGTVEETRRLFYLPFIIIAAKNDDKNTDEVYEIFTDLVEYDWDAIPISVKTGKNIDFLKTRIIERLDIIRVYSKSPGKSVDLKDPFVLKQGSTVEDFAVKVHKDFFHKLKSARAWGSTAFAGQMVQRDYVLSDGDIVELQVK
ncbi:MAG: TGS domain-containing protein [Desulfobacteraceae bacterium]|nr:50S ribosome-binding GTPase [Desulfobacteraceae bacterium]MBC2757953.1 TGS domain-containing protein [Desulfobacteraceae bacterium]